MPLSLFTLGCRPDPHNISRISPPKGPFGILLLGRPALGVFGDVDVLLVYHRNLMVARAVSVGPRAPARTAPAQRKKAKRAEHLAGREGRA